MSSKISSNGYSSRWKYRSPGLFSFISPMTSTFSFVKTESTFTEDQLSTTCSTLSFASGPRMRLSRFGRNSSLTFPPPPIILFRNSREIGRARSTVPQNRIYLTSFLNPRHVPGALSFERNWPFSSFHQFGRKWMSLSPLRYRWVWL